MKDLDPYTPHDPGRASPYVLSGCAETLEEPLVKGLGISIREVEGSKYCPYL